MDTLVLTLEYPNRASYYEDWRDAFRTAPEFKTTVVNIFTKDGRQEARRLAARAELIVLLHACTADSLDYVRPLTSALQARRGRLFCFVGNELNLPWAPLGAKIAWLGTVRPQIVATQMLEECGHFLYRDVAERAVSLPHGLNTDIFKSSRDYAARPIDIGARSYRYIAYLGDDDRNRLYDYFLGHRFVPALNLDFSTEHRFDRLGWAAFLDSCKGTISTEAAGWWLERDDRTVMAIREWAARQQGGGIVISADSWLQRLGRRLPHGLKVWLRRRLKSGLVRHEAMAAETLDPKEVFERFFSKVEKPPVYAKCISSRHFDAIGAGTVQIMFPGRFNDILVADRHYLALAPDFSNIDAVMARFRDPAEHRRIAGEALEHVLAHHTYRHRLAALAEMVK